MAIEKWSDDRLDDLARQLVETRQEVRSKINGLPERFGRLEERFDANAKAVHEDTLEVRREQERVREALEKKGKEDQDLLREQLRRRTVPPSALIAAFATVIASIVGAVAIILTAHP